MVQYWILTQETMPIFICWSHFNIFVVKIICFPRNCLCNKLSAPTPHQQSTQRSRAAVQLCCFTWRLISQKVISWDPVDPSFITSSHWNTWDFLLNRLIFFFKSKLLIQKSIKPNFFKSFKFFCRENRWIVSFEIKI